MKNRLITYGHDSRLDSGLVNLCEFDTGGDYNQSESYWANKVVSSWASDREKKENIRARQQRSKYSTNEHPWRSGYL